MKGLVLTLAAGTASYPDTSEPMTAEAIVAHISQFGSRLRTKRFMGQVLGRWPRQDQLIAFFLYVDFVTSLGIAIQLLLKLNNNLFPLRG